MLRPSKTPRNMHVTSLAARFAAAAVIFTGLAQAQDYGTADLPADLAAVGTKILGVMNKTPNASRNLGYSEGPVGDVDGNLYFTEDNSGLGNIWKVSPTGQASNFYNGPGMPNGLEFGTDGKMNSAEKGGIATYDVKVGGSSRAMIKTSGYLLDAGFRINDLTIASNGGMFFTNHGQGNQFFYRDPAGAVTAYGKDLANIGMGEPNGPEYIEERKMLLVNSSAENKVYRFDVSVDGKVSNRSVFTSIPVPDGLTVDEKGNIYIASYGNGSIYVFGPDGAASVDKALGSIKVGTGAAGNASNCAFGGIDGKTLFITGNGGAYKVQMKVKGRTRPGSTSLQRALLLRPAAAPSAREGFALDGRKIAARLPAALLLVSRPR